MIIEALLSAYECYNVTIVVIQHLQLYVLGQCRQLYSQGLDAMVDSTLQIPDDDGDIDEYENNDDDDDDGDEYNDDEDDELMMMMVILLSVMMMMILMMVLMMMMMINDTFQIPVLD